MGDLGKNEMRIALISRCSKLFNIILSKYFYFASRSQAAPQHSSCKQACLALHSVCTDIESHSCTASACPALSHIARYAPECRTSSYGTITQFKCKNNYEHLLIKKTGAKVAKKMSGGIEGLKVNEFADRNSGRISMKRTENANLSFIFEEENTILEKKNEQILLQSVRLQ